MNAIIKRKPSYLGTPMLRAYINGQEVGHQFYTANEVGSEFFAMNDVISQCRQYGVTRIEDEKGTVMYQQEARLL